MARRKNTTPAQIINQLRKAEVELANGKSVREVSKGWESASTRTTGGGESTEG